MWSIENQIPERVRAAWFVLAGVTVRNRLPALEAELAARGKELRELYRDPVSAASAFAAARRLYHGLGMDPSKHRPSSEALVRRILQGKGLFQVNTAVEGKTVVPVGDRRYNKTNKLTKEELVEAFGNARIID